MKSARLLVVPALLLAGLLVAAAPMLTQLPPSKGSPQVGAIAPGFTLPDTGGKPVTLAELLADPYAPSASLRAGAAQRPARSAPALLLLFYRGYW